MVTREIREEGARKLGVLLLYRKFLAIVIAFFVIYSTIFCSRFGISRFASSLAEKFRQAASEEDSSSVESEEN